MEKLIALLMGLFKKPEQKTVLKLAPVLPPRPHYTSTAGISLIKAFEGCFLNSYPDPASPLAKACRVERVNEYKNYASLTGWEKLSGDPWTIGYGATGKDVGPGMTWTEEYALERLINQELKEHERYVVAATKDWVTLTQGQFDALVSFCYNCGPGNLKKLLVDFTPSKFLLYNKAGGAVMAGLTKRRNAEKRMFEGGAR